MSAKKHILVTGANGQLGMEFKEIANAFPQYEFHFISRNELSIDNQDQVKAYFNSHSIHIVLNCAAYTAVDKAESEKEMALQINGDSVGFLAKLCHEQQIRFYHFSTDYVFDGKAQQPYKESDPTAPVNFYGETKLRGETLALQFNPDSCIIRTSWLYSRFGKNFVKTMMRLMLEKNSIQVVSDQLGSPTYAADLADAVMQMIVSGKIKNGIYHYCNEDIISWYDFAKAIREISGASCEVNAIPTEAYPTPAKRPGYSALSTQKIKTDFGLEIPNWRDSLEKCIQALNR